MGKIVVDSKTIREFGENILKKNEDIILLFDKMKRDSSSLGEILKSDAGTLYIETLEQLLDYNRKIINDSNISFANTIKEISNVYVELNNEIEHDINREWEII